MFLFHWLLGVVALIGAALICVLVVLNEVKCRKPSSLAPVARPSRLARRGKSSQRRSHSRNGMSDALWQQWNTENAALLQRQHVAADWSGFFSSATRTVRFILQAAILGVGAWLAILHEISPGVMIACSIMTSRALAPVEQAVGQWRGFVSARQSFRRPQAMLPAPLQLDPNVELPVPNKQLVVEQLYCCPAGMHSPVIQGVSLDLRAGEDAAVDIAVLGNDTDTDGDPFAIDSFTQGANGTVIDNGDGTLKYIPNADFNGTDTFTYTTSDGNDGTDTATVAPSPSPAPTMPR